MPPNYVAHARHRRYHPRIPMPIHFVFDPTRTAQAAAHLIKLSGGEINYMKLIKLLYLADRESFITTGRPITGAAMVSMPYGPVLSEVLDLIKHPPTGPWASYVTTPKDFNVSLKVQAPDDDELSRNDLRILRSVHAKFGDSDKWELVAKLHSIEGAPEWEDPSGSSILIPPEKILEKHGVAKDATAAFTHASEFLLAVAGLRR